MKAFAVILALASLVVGDQGNGGRKQRVLLTNDDGWAVAQIRDEYNQLKAAGFDVILSAPAENKSGTGSSTAAPTVLNITCEFDTCPIGAPPTGTDAHDRNLHYVNAFPVNSVQFGIQDFAKATWGTKPDFTVAGTNIGNNLGPVVNISGTVGAACESTKEGVPSFAFSGASGAQVSFTTLTDRTANTTIIEHIHTSLVLKFLATYLPASESSSHGRYDNRATNNKGKGKGQGQQPQELVPAGFSVNINFSPTDVCKNDPKNYVWIATRLVPSTAGVDTPRCGSRNLPDETTVNAAGCFATVSVFNVNSKSDAPAAAQKAVFDKLNSILRCKD
ncbi:survival protein sure-like phosphatase/nucleotidase [Macrolepiota fuliginosa MF-IS2]|uniref:Survival protein sure-like phosphatase/nucleotidase n=1 Tax=Macrolepiota fuliginosa MF-IS2 TaxID=1400762 RepID=A0A9P5X6F4_9AGAR|nr:survival protein sure-like phosphatase/nucleotidase [Macrolepiota fuliginosa MF-IS2]